MAAAPMTMPPAMVTHGKYSRSDSSKDKGLALGDVASVSATAAVWTTTAVGDGVVGAPEGAVVVTVKSWTSEGERVGFTVGEAVGDRVGVMVG